MDAEMIREAFHKMEIALKPYALFIHPEDHKKIKRWQDEFCPGALDRYEIIENEAMTQGKVAIIDREEMESWLNKIPEVEDGQNIIKD